MSISVAKGTLRKPSKGVIRKSACQENTQKTIKKMEDITYGEVEKYTQMIPLNNLSSSARQQINNLVFRFNYEQYGNETLVFDNWFLIGSFGYKQQKYWGDMDLRENLIFCCDPNAAIKAFIQTIKKIISYYVNNDRQWFKELKCGIDDRYAFLNPKERFAYMTLKYVSDKELVIKLKKLLEKNALDLVDFEEIIKLLKVNKKQQYEYKCARERILEILRRYYIIRWTASEVFNGFKMLRGNYRLNLFDAVQAKQAINLECVAIINNQLLDVSNFYVLTYIPYPEFAGLRNLPEKPINEISYDAVVINYNQLRFSDFFGHSIESLTDSINTLLYSCLHQDAFKAMKRMWSLARTILNYSDEEELILYANMLLTKIVPFISSDTSNLNNIKNGISVITGLIEDQVPLFPFKLSLQQIKTMKTRIGKITIFSNDDIQNIYNPMLDEMYYALFNKDYEATVNIGNKFTRMLSSIINDQALQYLYFANLYPTFYIPPGFQKYIKLLS